MVRAQPTRTLLILDIAEFSVCTVFLRIGTATPVRLTHDDVAESALALLILVAMLVVARLVVLVRHQARLLLRSANPVLTKVGRALVVRLAVLTIRTILFTILLTARVALSRHLATVGIVLAIVVAVAGMVGSSQLLPAVEFGARRNLGFALVVRAQPTFTLFVLDVAEFSVCTILLRVGATTPIRLTHDDVAESTLALLILVAMFVVARLVVLVRHQTRLLLRRAEPILAIVGGTLSVCLAVLTIRTVLFGVLLAARVALPRHLATVGVVLTVCVSVTGFVGGSQFLPAVEFGARRDFGFALVIGTESTLALVILFIAKLSILAILLRILFATHVWLSHDDVTESTLAPIVRVAIHLFVIALGFVLCKTRVALLLTEGLLVAVALSVVALDLLL